jgi:DNA-directed RNA polymerase specialized sigma24 family protein
MAGVSLDVLMTAALTGQPYNQQRLGRELKRYARRISNRFAARLPDDLHDDIAQEAIVILWHAGAATLTHKTVRQLLRKAVLEAVYIVLSDYAPTGERTRAAPKDAKIDRIAAEDASRTPTAKQIAHMATADGGFDLDRLPCTAPQTSAQAALDRIDVATILHRAPPSVAAALRLIYFDGETVVMAAQQAAISRFALNRQITSYSQMWRSAA